MFKVTTQWNPLQAKLKEIIRKKDRFDEMQQLLYEMHSIVHSSVVYGKPEPTYMDEVWSELESDVFCTMPTDKDDTVAWNIWHITRIEDLTSNYLVKGQSEVLNDSWLKRLNITVKDTGNAMSDSEIIDLSTKINKEALFEYRNAVGSSTQEIIKNLKPEDMKRKVSADGLKQIAAAGGVTEQADSVWLLDFWGKKTVAGIFQMPITRHQIVHLNDCKRLIEICRKRKYKS